MSDIEAYWNGRPCNVHHSQYPIGSLAWSNGVTLRKRFVEPHIPGFAQFERWRDKRVLEIGCGIGTDTLSFIQHGVGHIDAVDISGASIELATKRCDREIGSHWRDRARFWHLNAEERLPPHEVELAMGMPLTFNERYDLVYSFGVLHHTPNPDCVLRMAAQYMKPNAELRIMLYATWSLKHILGQQPEAQAGCPWAQTYTQREATKLLNDSGFDVVSIHKTHIFPYRVPDYIRHEYVKHWYYRAMPAWAMKWFESKLGWHLLIVAKKSHHRPARIWRLSEV